MTATTYYALTAEQPLVKAQPTLDTHLTCGATGQYQRAPVPGRVIACLRGSVLLETCVATYRRHAVDHDGLCRWCRCAWPCAPHRFATTVIQAAGEDPRRYEGAPMPPREAAFSSTVDTAELPTGPSGIDGYPVGGANRRRTQDTWER
jgi:hypothetical protein